MIVFFIRGRSGLVRNPLLTLLTIIIIILTVFPTFLIGDAIYDLVEYMQREEDTEDENGFGLTDLQECQHILSSSESQIHKLWPNQQPDWADDPTDPLHNYPRFRKLGEECTIEAEEKFYKELKDIARLKAKDDNQYKGKKVEGRLSNHYYVRKWSNAWHVALNDKSVRHQLCNPRWALQCVNKACECHKVSIADPRHAGMGIIPLKINVSDPADKEEPYRCVSTFQTSCEWYRPYLGLCVVNCEEGSRCTGLLSQGGAIKENKCCKEPKDGKTLDDVFEQCENQPEHTTEQGATRLLNSFGLGILLPVAIGVVMYFHLWYS